MCDVCDSVEELERKKFNLQVEIEKIEYHIKELEIDYKNILIQNCTHSTVYLVECAIHNNKDKIIYCNKKINYYQTLIDYRNKKFKK